jgi:hypothetical protein
LDSSAVEPEIKIGALPVDPERCITDSGDVPAISLQHHHWHQELRPKLKAHKIT